MLDAAAASFSSGPAPSHTSDVCEDALGVWQGVMRGQWSVVESFELDEWRVLIAQRSLGGSRDPDTLSECESRVLALAAGGHADKFIAHRLGIAEGTVSACLCHGLNKLKISGRIDLVRDLGFRPSGQGTRKDDGARVVTLPMPTGTRTRHLGSDVAIIDFPIPRITMPTQLTAAEREVARLVFEGGTNEQIARARGASIKTVGNQLGAIFRKLSVSSRFALVLYLRHGRADIARRATPSTMRRLLRR